MDEDEPRWWEVVLNGAALIMLFLVSLRFMIWVFWK
jgi:hypothetical protein